VRRFFSIVCLVALICASASAQPRNVIQAPPTLLNGENEAPFIYLTKGNQFEYRITHAVDGIPVDPSFLRFTVTGEQNPVAGADDFFILVQTYSSDKLIRQAQCYIRRQRGRIHLMGASQMGSSDCNWQSPFSHQDLTVAEASSNVTIGDQSVHVSSIGTYEHFWGDQNGDNGFISFRYADGLGLYRFESRTSDSPMEQNPQYEEWLGELQYALVDGVEYGESIVQQRFEAGDVVLELTPAQ